MMHEAPLSRWRGRVAAAWKCRSGNCSGDESMFDDNEEEEEEEKRRKKEMMIA